MKVLKTVIVALLVILVACGSPEEEPGPSQGQDRSPVSEEPAGPTPTPGPVVSQPTVNVNKEWQTIISENKTLESDGIEYTIKQLRFGTPEELLPNLAFEELQELNLDAAQAIIGIIVKVVNKRNSTITVTPGGNNASVLVNNELTKPIPQLSEVRGELPAGSQSNFTVLFPLVVNSLEDITELFFLINEHRFHYIELVATN